MVPIQIATGTLELPSEFWQSSKRTTQKDTKRLDALNLQTVKFQTLHEKPWALDQKSYQKPFKTSNTNTPQTRKKKQEKIAQDPQD